MALAGKHFGAVETEGADAEEDFAFGRGGNGTRFELDSRGRTWGVDNSGAHARGGHSSSAGEKGVRTTVQGLDPGMEVVLVGFVMY